MPDSTPAAALTIVSDVREDSPIPESGMGHATALTHPDARVVILSFAAGHLLKEHATPFPIIMQALDGELIVRADGLNATLSQPGQPPHVIALPSRTEGECLTEELRRMDDDPVYGEALTQIAHC